MFQLSRREVVVLYGVAWAKYFSIFKTWYMSQRFGLNIFWKRRAETIYIDFNSFPAFWFYEKLVPVSFSETIDFILYTWAVSWSYTLYSSVEHWASIKARAEDIMYSFVCVSDIAASLFFKFRRIEVREFLWIFIAFLFLHFGIIQASSIYSYRRSCFHSSCLKT